MADLTQLLRALRREHRERRRDTTGARRESAEAAILGGVQAVITDVLRARQPPVAAERSLVAGAYVADDGEVDVGPLISWMHDHGVTVALPTLGTDPNGEKMWFRTWERDGALRTGRFDLSEPADGAEVAPADLNVVVTPLVAFNRTCDRVGRGGGFYDRTFGPLLSQEKRPILVGVAFEHQRAPELPVQDHDAPLDAVITELGIRWRAAGVG